MGVAVAAQVEKKCYKNQTAGWLGVVKLNHLGAQEGFSIEPQGTVWLSDDEARLTARAPRDPANNPFIDQNFLFYDEAGTIVEAPMRPLVLVADPSSEPSQDRYVPGLDDTVIDAGRTDAQTALASNVDRPVPTEPEAPTPVPPLATAVPPGQAIPGFLRGGDAPAPPPEDELKTGSPTTEPPPQKPAPQTVGSSRRTVPSESAGVAEGAGAPSEQGAPGEETAAHVESGEETGAAATPVGQAPEGEYAQAEEIGSPDAPKAKAAPKAKETK